MATTYEAIRDRQIVLVEALTPTSMSATGFRVSRDTEDFRGWADKSDVAAFRRFSISEFFSEDLPEVSDESEEWIDGTQEIDIAYDKGKGSKYGRGRRRDMNDIMREDEHLIRKALGAYGRGNYTMQVATPWLSTEQEEQNTTIIQTIAFRVAYYGTIPSTSYSAMQNETEQSFQYTTTTSADSYTVTIPTAMTDTTYVVQATISTVPSDEPIAALRDPGHRYGHRPHREG
jgi:hypothetical protein